MRCGLEDIFEIILVVKSFQKKTRSFSFIVALVLVKRETIRIFLQFFIRRGTYGLAYLWFLSFALYFRFQALCRLTS